MNNLKEWAAPAVLSAVFIASLGFITSTINARIGAVESQVADTKRELGDRIDRIEDRLASRMDKLDGKMDMLLAAQGVIAPAKHK